MATGSATDGLRLWDVSADEAARKADKPQQKLANVAVPGHNGGSPSSIRTFLDGCVMRKRELVKGSLWWSPSL